MSNKISISGTIGLDEKDAFNHIADTYVISPSLSKIPGFNTKLLKACEELNGVATFNYPAKTFSIVIEDNSDEMVLTEAVEEEEEVTEEEDTDSDLPPSVTETTVEDADEDDDDWG